MFYYFFLKIFLFLGCFFKLKKYKNNEQKYKQLKKRNKNFCKYLGHKKDKATQTLFKEK